MIRLRTAALLMLVSAPAFAQFSDFSKVEIKATKVNGNVYMLEGAGGNIGASVGEDGILIIDDQFAPLAPKIKAALKGIADKPIKWVLNTHHHPDHTNGNQVFGAEAPIVAHANVRKHLETTGIDFNKREPAPKQALPVVTYNDSLSLWVNGEEVRVTHYAPGHTDGDSVILFTKSNVAHMGDDTVIGGFPYIDIEGGGNIKGIIAAADRAIKELPPDVKIIPGHGPLTDINGLKEFSATMKEIVATVEKAMKSGKTAAQAKQAKLLSKWEKLGHQFVTEDMFIDMLYADLGRKGGAAPKK